MTTAMNENRKEQWASDAKARLENVVSEVRNLDPERIKQAAAELTSRVRDSSTEVYDEALAYVRRNPVQAALGLCAFGFFAGVIAGAMRRSA
jgi:ElaB/YqjD/DUF883 family membrane-anchored ribosome-binding protein